MRAIEAETFSGYGGLRQVAGWRRAISYLEIPARDASGILRK